MGQRWVGNKRVSSVNESSPLKDIILSESIQIHNYLLSQSWLGGYGGRLSQEALVISIGIFEKFRRVSTKAVGDAEVSKQKGAWGKGQPAFGVHDDFLQWVGDTFI